MVDRPDYEERVDWLVALSREPRHAGPMDDVLRQQGLSGTIAKIAHNFGLTYETVRKDMEARNRSWVPPKGSHGPAQLDPLSCLTEFPLDASFEKRVDASCRSIPKGRIRPLLTTLAWVDTDAEFRMACYKQNGDNAMLVLAEHHRDKIDYIKAALARELGASRFDRLYEPLRRKEFRDEAERRNKVKHEMLLTDPTCPFAKVVQEAVGHGGFHHGVLATDKPLLRWVYDCGSWRKGGREALNRCISRLALQVAGDDSARIDVLFVSHFDADHVVGLRRLLKAVRGKVDTVVIPYLGAAGTFAALAQAAAQGRLSSQLANQLVDPVRWFRDLGVPQIIQLRPGLPPLGGGGEPRMPEHGPPAAGGEYSPVQIRSALIDADGKLLKARRRVAKPGAVMGVRTYSGDWADWWLVPFVQPMPRAVLRRVRREAVKMVGVPIKSAAFKERLLRRLRTRPGVRKLKASYRRAGLADSNGMTLSLFAGPRQSKREKRSLFRLAQNGLVQWPAEKAAGQQRCGWLLSGDATLGSGDGSWTRFYAAFKDVVGTMMLPHHGARRNFGLAMLDCAPHATLFVTADARDKKRPSEDVRISVKAHGGKSIWKVSERRNRAIVQISGPLHEPETYKPPPSAW